MLERLNVKKVFIGTVAAFALLTLVGALVIYIVVIPGLPTIESLKDVHFQVPLRVFSREGKLIAEFGEKKRLPVKIAEVPDLLIKAVLAAEDDRFFTHPGVDYQGLLRAAFILVKTGEKAQGGSTITMQVARNFFLTSEKTYFRKLSEIFLALKIERELSKNEILELYLNKIYLGNRAYGVAAAARVYYGTDIKSLTLEQMAMIAGLPKAPSIFNPVVNPDRALMRRNYVLRRMHDLKNIDDAAFEAASKATSTARLHALSEEVDAPYVAEMARAVVVERFGNEAYTEGYNVHTTVDGKLQPIATEVLRRALVDYDERHGYRGPESHVDLATDSAADEWAEALSDVSPVAGLFPAIVVGVGAQTATVYLSDHRKIGLDWNALSWARPYLNENALGPSPKAVNDVLKVGDIIRVRLLATNKWRLTQIPAVEGALVSLSPRDGSILSLVGGFDFYRSKFNRVIQAERQPGSSFKPFIYSAALDNGFTTASLVNDAPVVFDDPGLESVWRPENYTGKFYGPTRLREGLVNSRNLISIRVLQAMGIDTALKHAARFGFRAEHLPRNLSLALGSGTVTPMELVTGYAVFANGGFRVEPYLVQKIIGPDGKTVFEASPAIVCAKCEENSDSTDASMANEPNATKQLVALKDLSTSINTRPEKIAPRVVPAQNIFLTTSMLKDVVRRGTGKPAMQLKRNDLAGKTGTTNDQRDTWFAGFNPEVVTVSWVGFDNTQPLGDGESGARAALPIWINFMAKALEGLPERDVEQPPGLVSVKIDPGTGLLAGSDNPAAIFEIFRTDTVPKQISDTVPASMGAGGGGEGGSGSDAEQLF